VPITSKAAVEAEYATKKQQVIDYDPVTLNDDLAKVEQLSAFVSDVARLAAMVDASDGKAAGSQSEGLRVASAALSEISSVVRRLIADAQAAAEDAPPPVGP
jgi:hypothetical protein